MVVSGSNFREYFEIAKCIQKKINTTNSASIPPNRADVPRQITKPAVAITPIIDAGAIAPFHNSNSGDELTLLPYPSC